MKNNKVKSFTFKVAQKSEVNKSQWKAREGVAVAGCTLQRLFGDEFDFKLCYPNGQDCNVYC